MKTIIQAAAAAAILVGGQASAAEGDIFLGGFRDDQKSVVVFAFEDPTTPRDAMAVYARPDYAPADGEAFDPFKACAYTFDFADSPIQVNYVPKAIYGPSSGQATLLFPDLPTFFQQKAMQMLVDRGEVQTETREFGLYASCVAFIWATQLTQDAETWRRVVREVTGQQPAQ